MSIYINYASAAGHSKSIIDTGTAYTSLSLQEISGSNTSSCKQADRIRGRIQKQMAQYQELAIRDGKHIEQLANYFQNEDEKLTSKTKTQFGEVK